MLLKPTTLQIIYKKLLFKLLKGSEGISIFLSVSVVYGLKTFTRLWEHVWASEVASLLEVLLEVCVWYVLL